MASATFSPSNSSIHTWFSFNGTNLPKLPTCQWNHTDVSCTQVCNDSVALFTSQSDNLVTCGLWTSLVLKYIQQNGTYFPTDNFETAENISRIILPPFERFDLNTSNFRNASIYADTISNCFQSIYTNVKEYSFDDDGNDKIATACTRQVLFPAAGSNSSVKDCLGAICSPLTLDPDLAGIGVSVLA